MADFWGVAEKYGLSVAFLILAVIAYHTDMIVSGARLRRAERERDAVLRAVIAQARSNVRTAAAAQSTASVAEQTMAALLAQHGSEAEDAGLAP